MIGLTNLLTEQIKAREVKRIYRAIVKGEIAESRGRIEAPIGRHPKDRKKNGNQYERWQRGGY
jgi:23S rRNA-/tRNA-specific pseudouridylate synthase